MHCDTIDAPIAEGTTLQAELKIIPIKTVIQTKKRLCLRNAKENNRNQGLE